MDDAGSNPDIQPQPYSALLGSFVEFVCGQISLCRRWTEGNLKWGKSRQREVSGKLQKKKGRVRRSMRGRMTEGEEDEVLSRQI